MSAFHGRCFNIHPFHPAPAIQTEPTWTLFRSNALNHHPRTFGQFLPEWRDSTTIIISATASTIPGIIKFLRSQRYPWQFASFAKSSCSLVHVFVSSKASKLLANSSSASDVRLLSPLARKSIKSPTTVLTARVASTRRVVGKKFRRQDGGHHLYPTGNCSRQSNGHIASAFEAPTHVLQRKVAGIAHALWKWPSSKKPASFARAFVPGHFSPGPQSFVERDLSPRSSPQ